MTEKFRIGVGKLNITPPLSFPYLGFFPRHAFFKGIHDELFVRSLVVSHHGEEIAIIASDTFGFNNHILGKDRNFTEEVRIRIEEMTGIDRRNIMIASSHIHSTPDTLGFRPLDRKSLLWIESLIEKIATSVLLAKEDMFKADLKVATGQLKGITKNRRGDKCLDTEVIMLLFNSHGKKAIIVNFACHPVIVQVQDLVSADFVGVLENTVEKTLSGVRGCLFLQGACGDVNPIMGNTKDFDDVYHLGMALAGETIKLYSLTKIKKDSTQTPSLKVVSEKVLLPSRPLPPIGEVTKELEELKAKLERAEGKEREKLRRELRRKEEVYFRVLEGKGPFKAEIQVLRIGETLLIGIPGEPFCKMGIEIKRISKPLLGVPVGYANGYFGYLAPPDAWEKGGYEVSCGPWSKVSSESYNILLEAFKKLRGKIE